MSAILFFDSVLPGRSHQKNGNVASVLQFGTYLNLQGIFFFPLSGCKLIFHGHCMYSNSHVVYIHSTPKETIHFVFGQEYEMQLGQDLNQGLGDSLLEFRTKRNQVCEKSGSPVPINITCHQTFHWDSGTTWYHLVRNSNGPLGSQTPNITE